MKLEQKNLTERIHDDLHQKISDGRLKIGDRVVIDKLASEYGTSLIPVREALARLLAERLVTYENNKGYRIAAAPDFAEMAKLFDARLILEIGSLEHGFHRVDDKLIQELRTINQEIADGNYGTDFPEYKAFIDLNARFHEILVGLADNPFISDAYMRLGYHQRAAQTLVGYGVRQLSEIVKEHDAIIKGLESRSLPDTRDALMSHIRGGLSQSPLRQDNED